VTTRKSLAVLLGAPRFALEHFDPDRMRSIFETVAQNDELFARWQAEVSGAAERNDLIRRVSVAEEDARRASSVQASATADLDELSAQLAKVQGQFKELQSESAGLSERERRQVLIDAAKVVAQVAATVEGDGRALDHDALSRKVTLLAERFGLHADARQGDSVAFDPSRHSAPGKRPEVGEIVDVARAGYTWEDGSERVVVLPALVTRASGIEEGA
jgi:molecular chaperone GrpE (heat shock protein)